jgi:hypothetical protein
MRRAFADFSPAVPAAFAAGLGVSLWIFLLPAGVVQKGPTPVLPAFGRAAGRVVADLPVAVGRPASEVRAAVPRAAVPRAAASPHSKLVVALRASAAKARPVHHRARTGVVPRASSAPVPAVVPPAPRAPVTKSWLFSTSPKGKGKARGHAPKPRAETPTPHLSGHGKALGRSNEHEDRLAHGPAGSPASAPRLPPPPKDNGGGNGRKGNGGGNADKGNGGGKADKGNGGGNGRKLGWEKR